MLRSSTFMLTLIAALAPCSFAQTNPAEHAAHHPASAPTAAAAASAPAQAKGMGMGMGMMDAHMQAMRAMQDKMMAARSPEERQALMPEKMRLMREGLALMDGMKPKTGAKPADLASRQAMMEKRMDMMQSMMKMMMDCMPAQAPK